MAKSGIHIVYPIETLSLKKYLESRCIHMRLANKYCVEAIVKNEKRKNRLHYVGFVSNNLGIIYKSAWGVTGSILVTITTITKQGMRRTEPTSKELLVFSGFMDFLSYLELKDLDEPECDVLVLNGCSNVEKGMRFMRQHLYVFCYFSLDERGRKCQRHIDENLKGCIIMDCSDRYEGCEDLNAYLVKRRTEEAAPFNPRRPKASLKKADK